jgi:acetylornithine deacetylase/succinyl-diaminopimelate desuccinylase-like protein
LVQRSYAVKPQSLGDLAAEPALRGVWQWFATEKKWINQKHLDLVRIPAPTFQEQKRAEWMISEFRAMGCDAKLDRAGNVVAYPGNAGEGPLVALTAHMDTVLEPRSPDAIRFGRDGKLHGPGVSDNGAGLAALLAIAQAIRSSPLLIGSPLPLVMVANVGEEGEGNLSGMRYLCRPSGLVARIDSWVVLDGPSLDHVTTRALASRRFEVTVTGPGGHSWSDYGVANPVHALSRAIALFSDHQPANGSRPRTSCNFGLIEGGASINSIPTSACAKLDIRSENPQRIEELSALLTTALERALETENDRSPAGRVAAKVREIGSRPGGQLSEPAPVLAYLRAIDEYLGLRTHQDCASTDANIPLSLGMQAVSIGAGGVGGGAHTPAEWYYAEGREVGLRRILLLTTLLMRDVNPAAAS